MIQIAQLDQYQTGNEDTTPYDTGKRGVHLKKLSANFA